MESDSFTEEVGAGGAGAGSAIGREGGGGGREGGTCDI